MNNLKLYLIKILIFSIPLLVLAFVLNYIADEGLKRTDYINYKQWSRLYEEKAEADILIVGNSRAACHVDPLLLGKNLFSNVYNLGILGGGPLLQYHAYRLYRKQNSRKPSLILLNVDWITIGSIKTDLKFRKADYLPWCADSDWEPIIENSGYTLFDRYLPLLKYGTRLHSLQLGLYSYWGIKKYDIQNNETYEGGYLKSKQTYFNNHTLNIQLRRGDLSATTDFFRHCRQEGIQIVGYYSPIHSDFKNNFDHYQTIHTTIDSLLSAWNIPFLDYSTAPIGGDTAYFRDCVHLNIRGVEWLTKRLACDIDSLSNRLSVSKGIEQ